jgi:hypothetical protein
MSYCFRFFTSLLGTKGNGAAPDSDVSESEKLVQNLEFCVDRICDIFGLRQVVQDFDENYYEEEKRSKVKPSVTIS